MSEQQKKVAAPPSVPAYVPEDMISAWLWFRENGTQWLITIAAAVLLAVGVSVFLRHRAAQAARASEQLGAAPSVEALEKTIAEYGDTAPGVAAKLKLAKAYYDACKYPEALAEYDKFVAEHGTHPFADVARVGRGYALCGMNRNEEALAVFTSFREKNPAHYLAQQAAFGEAACLTMLGKKDAAKNLLEEIRVANRETPWESAAKRMEGAVDRYQVRAGRSLLEQADALAPLIPMAAKTPPPFKPAATNTAP